MSKKPSRGRGGSRRAWKPVLGLVDEPGGRRGHVRTGASGRQAVAGTVFDQPEPEELIELTVIVPARNEEDCLGACLRVAGEPVGRDLRAGQRLGADRGGRPLDRPDGRDRARLCRGDGDAGGQAGKGMDGQGERHVDGGAAGARALAAVYRCGHDARAGRSAPGDARGGAAQGGDAELLAAADRERAWRSGR